MRNHLRRASGAHPTTTNHRSRTPKWRSRRHGAQMRIARILLERGSSGTGASAGQVTNETPNCANMPAESPNLK